METSLLASEIVPLIAFGTLVMVILALSIVLLYHIQQKKIVRQQLTAQEMELQYQQELLQRNMMTQEEERRRIAADLHDEIGSKLNVLHLNLHRIKKTPPDHVEFMPLWDEIGNLLNNTIETTRRISHELLPPILEDMGLPEALEELSKQLRQSGSLEITLECNVKRQTLESPLVKLNVFRIVQELVSNSIKHAEATQIDIHLFEQDDLVHLLYRDNGRGFDPDKNIRSGMGLRNLNSRVKILEGTSAMKSTPGKGFEYLLSFKQFETFEYHKNE